MTGPKISDQAETDLDDLWADIAADSPEAASRTIRAILHGCRMHGHFPGMGQGRDELEPGLRSFVVSSHVIFYRALEDNIEILRVLHAPRDIDRIINPDE